LIAEILHAFLGDVWVAGIGHLHEIEHRSYLFAAKSASWLSVKAVYDTGVSGHRGAETVLFLRPHLRATGVELRKTQEGWSEWLAKQDLMIGERDALGAFK
jgi:hypothetical protein